MNNRDTLQYLSEQALCLGRKLEELKSITRAGRTEYSILSKKVRWLFEFIANHCDGTHEYSSTSHSRDAGSMHNLRYKIRDVKNECEKFKGDALVKSIPDIISRYEYGLELLKN
jgi:hypothetical protein